MIKIVYKSFAIVMYYEFVFCNYLSDIIIFFLTPIARLDSVSRIIVFDSRAFRDYEKYLNLDLALDTSKMTKYKWLKLEKFVIYDFNAFIKVSLVHYSTNQTNVTGK